MNKKKSPVVYTNTAKCRDCYRCVRVCPVNAIKMHNGQAQVIEENCISCGTCISECPQQAKSYRHELDTVLDLLDKYDSVAITVAPSFAAVYPEWTHLRLASALRSTGFAYVGETAVGAAIVADKTREYIESHPNKNIICTACPAIVNYVEKYEPAFIRNLLPIASPMVVHARMLKRKAGYEKVVFAGPCIAKKSEADREENNFDIDAVLTFEKLEELLRIKNVVLEECEESAFDEIPGKDARLFPIEGGLLKTMGINETTDKFIATSGFDEFIDALAAFNDNLIVIEPLFCKHGCINGPVIAKNKSRLTYRNNILSYNTKNKGQAELAKVSERISRADFHIRQTLEKKNITEEKIREVLMQTGKYKPEDELNCGACGFSSCREKAIAVIRGLAEVEMCMPYMRRKAEQKTNLIIERDPNGFIIIDKNLKIQSMNPAFVKMFCCSNAIVGQPVSYLLDPDPFEQIATGQQSLIRKEIKYPNYGLICYLVVFAVPEEKQIIGVFMDITDVIQNQDKLKNMKQQTILQVNELIDHQVNMAQELARFLGANTAKGEMLMQKLIDAIEK